MIAGLSIFQISLSNFDPNASIGNFASIASINCLLDAGSQVPSGDSWQRYRRRLVGFIFTGSSV